MVTPRRSAFHTSDGWREVTGEGEHPGPDGAAEPTGQPQPDCCTDEPVPAERGIFARLKGATRRALGDIDSAMTNDPAARNRLEVALTYPGVHALLLHRVAHSLWRREYNLAARVISHLNRMTTGIEIHPGARVGEGVFIDHGMGIVIGETAVVGDGTLLYKGVVLGGTSLERTVRHPHIGRNVVVGSNACVLGNIHIGDNAKVGSGSVVIRDIPTGATVVGVPGRVVIDEDGVHRGAADHEHADLPDPVQQALNRLQDQIDELEKKLDKKP